MGDDQQCLDAVAKGQRLKDAHQLVEAREQLRICAAPSCPAVVLTDCANWLDEVEKALPSIVLTARNAAGADQVDVKVSIDGQPFVSKLDGHAVPMNAGPHRFHFEDAAGASVDRLVLVKEGDKYLAISADMPPPPRASSSSWEAVGWALGGVGVAGLLAGGAFGLLAIHDKDSAHCDSKNVCDPGTTDAIKTAALASNIGWIAGGVLLGGGATLLLVSRGPGHESRATAATTPTVAIGVGSLVVKGAW
jgi:hypothetical protein